MFGRPLTFIPVPAWVGIDADEPWLSRRGGLRCDRPRGRRGRPRGEGWGRGPRTRRGDIKFILLALLAEGPNHGYNLIKEMENRYGQFRRLSPGSVYPTLQMLEEGGYLTSEQQEGKRVYTITDAGRALLEERSRQRDADRSGDFIDAPAEFGDLREAATELADTVSQVARGGKVEQMRRVREMLAQVKRDIHAMLSEP
ncbi:MAG: PadR family transcriptional regulator [Cyanobacteria bacterium J06648_11]